MGFNLLDLLSGAAPAAASAAQAAPTPVEGVTVTANRPPPQAPPSLAPNDGYTSLTPGMGAHTAYNNTPELNDIQDVRNHYPEATHEGSGLINMLHTKGTLRNVLGTLGDAFLVQSGHQPVYAAQNQREQLAQAAAGFENDPGAAADRISQTAVPGSMKEAQDMYTTAQNEQLRKATMQNTQAYRDSMMQDREQNHAAQQAQAQQKTDDRVRSLNYGMLSAAAKAGPAQYAAARAAAVGRVGRMKDTGIDPDTEYPTDPKDFVNGYGLNANQEVRSQQAQAAQAARNQQNSASNALRARGQNMAQRPAPQMNSTTQLQGLIAKQNAGQQLTPAEQAVWTHVTAVKGGGAHLNIPGLGGSSPAATSSAPITHTYPSGRTVQYVNGKWIPK